MYPFTQFSPMGTSYKVTVQYQDQETDIGTIYVYVCGFIPFYHMHRFM